MNWCIKMRYSTEPRDRIYVKWHGFLSLAKNMGKNLSTYGQKLLDSAKKSTADAIKTASKRAIQKRAEATVDLIDNILLTKLQVFQQSCTQKSSQQICTQKMMMLIAK